MTEPTDQFLSTADAMAYLEFKFKRPINPATFRHWIRKGAFPNQLAKGEGNAKRYTFPVSDLDAFDPESIKGEPGRKADPDSPWHGYRDAGGAEQWKMQQRQRRSKWSKSKESET